MELIRGSHSARPVRGYFARSIFIVIWVAASILLGSCKEDEVKSSNELISAFGGSCADSGPWTQAAFIHNNALIGIVRSLKDRDPCKAFATRLSTIETLGGQIESLRKRQDYIDYRKSEEELQELSLALRTAPAGSGLASELSAELVSTQIGLARRRAAYGVGEEISGKDRYKDSTRDYATYVQEMLSEIGGLGECLRSSPGAAVELVTHLMAMGGSFASPVYGAGAAALGQLMNVGVEYVRQAKKDDAIWKYYAVQMPKALSCALESMSELYCDAVDSAELVLMGLDSYPSPGMGPSEIWHGLDLLDRRLPTLNRWLTRLRNGVIPRDTGQFQEQEQAWSRLNTVDRAFRLVNSLTSKASDEIEAAPTPEDKKTFLISLLKDLAQYLSGQYGSGSTINDPSNPFYERSSSRAVYACWLVRGPKTNIVDCKINSTDDFLVYLLSLNPADLKQVTTNWDAIYASVKALADAQFARTITVNPGMLLASARELDQGKISAFDALQFTKKFIEAQLRMDDGSNPFLKDELEKGLVAVAEALKVLAMDPAVVLTGCTAEPGDSDALNLCKIQKLFGAFDLRRGLQPFNDRLAQFVEWDLSRRLKKGEFPKDVTEILKAAGSDLRLRLEAAGVDTTSVISDINSARSITQGNLEITRQFFAKSLERSIDLLSKQGRDAGEPARGPNRPNGQTLGQLCTLLLSTGMEWPANVKWDACSHANLDSVQKDPHGKISIDVSALRKKLQGKPLETRMCTYHKFLRAQKLARILGDGAHYSARPREPRDLFWQQLE